MHSQIIPITELPTVKMNVGQIIMLPRCNRRLDKIFYLLAAGQFLTAVVGALLGLLVAPASLFVSRTETEAVAWLAVGVAALWFAALGMLAMPFAIAAARATRGAKIYGCIAAALTFLQFPLGTIFGGYLFWRLRKV